MTETLQNHPPIQTLKIPASELELKRARKSIASGLSSYARVRDNQVVFARGKGAYLWDLDGQRYIDFVCAHGPVFLGHSPDPVVAAAAKSIENGLQFGGPHKTETELAEGALDLLPWADSVAFVSTGSEAVHFALRIARVSTGRRKVIKFDGHYHGWIDPIYVNSPSVNPLAAGSSTTSSATELATGQVPSVSNVSGQEPSVEVIVAEWNNLEAFQDLIAEIGHDVAAVLMEPLSTNFGTFFPREEFLTTVRKICRDRGILLIFDEVVTGFRLAPGGAAELVGVQPDLATYAKALGSGFPIAMVAGTSEAMKAVDDGRVLSSGTYSGTPASVTAALATINEIKRQGSALYTRLDELAQQLAAGFEQAGRDLGAPIHVNQIGSLAQILYGDMGHATTIAAVNTSDKRAVSNICERMITHGIFTSRKGLFYLNAGHTSEDIDQAIAVFRQSLANYLAEFDRG